MITEQELRDLYRRESYETFSLPEATKLTPAARQFLVDRRIPILEAEGLKRPAAKSENMTHLSGQELVSKSHPRIRFRGQIDMLYAELLEMELYCKTEVEAHENSPIYQDIKVIRKYIGQMMTSEATGKELPFIDFRGWSPEEIRERSHHPKEHYGIGHFRAHPKNGPKMLKLNTLRTHIRALELSAVDAFMTEATVGDKRPDLILALNRMSSLVYIIMCQLRADEIQGENNHG